MAVLTTLVVAIALHGGAMHRSDFLMADGRSTGGAVSPIRSAVARVDVMTTMAANFDSALSLQRTSVMSEPAAESCSCAFALTGHGEAYNEQAFHHFLAIERKRSEASARPFLLLLVDFEKHRGTAVAVDNEAASHLFAALAQSLRDTDVIGWYREHRVAGAVLTDLGEALHSITPTINARVRGLLQRDLPAGLASLVQVRLYQMPARAESAVGTVA